MDKDELIEKMDSFDVSKLKGLNINKEEIKQKLILLILIDWQGLLGKKEIYLLKNLKNY